MLNRTSAAVAALSIFALSGVAADSARADEKAAVQVRGVIADVTESDDGVVSALIEVDDQTLSVVITPDTEVTVDGQGAAVEDVWDQVGAGALVEYVPGGQQLVARSLAIEGVVDEEFDEEGFAEEE